MRIWLCSRKIEIDWDKKTRAMWSKRRCKNQIDDRSLTPRGENSYNCRIDTIEYFILITYKLNSECNNVKLPNNSLIICRSAFIFNKFNVSSLHTFMEHNWLDRKRNLKCRITISTSWNSITVHFASYRRDKLARNKFARSVK